MKTIKRQQRTIGAIVKIPLENDYHTYARILETRLAFYNVRTKNDMEIEEIVKKPILFTIIVYDEIITKGHWTKIGKKLPIENNPEFSKPFYMEDIWQKKLWICKGLEKIEATKEEITSLESYTVWDYENIQERLNDHYANRKNEYVEDMKAGKQISGMINRALKRKKELEVLK